ncbi:MAG: GSCFA domain-containing protein [Chitinophagaceae bacterium]|nr:GSCFA domain-containing protein [Chitinophagaceae bacterium]
MAEFRLALHIPPFSQKIHHRHRVMLMGSCFTEHMSKQLSLYKFPVLENPNGILFNPVSVSRSIITYIENKKYTEEELFYFNELWHSWDHHSRYSHPDKAAALNLINQSQADAHEYLQQADWLIITLGSAFVYEGLETAAGLFQAEKRRGTVVANCHKVPANQFRKRLLSMQEVLSALDHLRYRLLQFNPGIKFIYTISPVRHIRDGLIENNKSKATLIQAVHQMVEKFENHYYFPSYELVIDDLRDYRFYAEDMVHPNYLATNYVWEHFRAACIDPSSHEVMRELEEINRAMRHRPFNPDSEAHKRFLSLHLERLRTLQKQYPFLDFTGENKHFSGA